MMRRPEAGFTLMETIVALVVFTGIVIALERGSALGWRAIRLADLERNALILARAKLAAAGIDKPVGEGLDEEGDDNRFHWHVSTSPYGQTSSSQRLAAYWVSAAVSWRDRPVGPLRTIELRTLKLTVAP